MEQKLLLRIWWKCSRILLMFMRGILHQKWGILLGSWKWSLVWRNRGSWRSWLGGLRGGMQGMKFIRLIRRFLVFYFQFLLVYLENRYLVIFVQVSFASWHWWRYLNRNNMYNLWIWLIFIKRAHKMDLPSLKYLSSARYQIEGILLSKWGYFIYKKQRIINNNKESLNLVHPLRELADRT